MSQEWRSVDLVDADLKGNQFRGYAAVFDSPWNQKLIDATGYVEKVARGVFRKALAKDPDVPFLLGHDRNQFLGRTGSGNVRLREDGSGLLVEAKLPANHLGEYARSLIESGDIKGMSYGMSLNPKQDTVISRAGGVVTRTIANIHDLLDVSLTWEPAYQATTVELRSHGFVASSLQEVLSGTETQTEERGSDESPDDEAWWGEEPPEPAAKDSSKPWWESYIDQIEGR